MEELQKYQQLTLDWADAGQPKAMPIQLVTSFGGDPYGGQGTYMNAYSAMSVPAFNSGIQFLCNMLAMFSVGVFLDNGKQRSPAPHYLNNILSRNMNPYVSAFKTLRTWYYHRFVWSNGYLKVRRDPLTNKVKRLINLNPEITTPFVYEGEIYYYVALEEPIILNGVDVLHISALSFDGVTGNDQLPLMSQSLQVSKSADRYSANYFRKGSFIKGSIEVPGVLTDAQFNSMKSNLDKYRGVDGEGSLETLLLQAGAKLNNSTVPNQTSQLIETRRWGVIEIAQWLRIPPHILYELSHGKWNSVQQMGQEVIKYTFGPEIRQTEDEYNLKLLTPTEQSQGYYIRVKADTLAKADPSAQRAEILQLVNGGLMVPNVGCAILELPDLGPEGDKLRVPVNFPAVASDPTAPGATEGVGDDSSTDSDAPDGGKGSGGAAKGDSTDDEIEQSGDNLDGRPSYASIIAPVLASIVQRVETKTANAFQSREGQAKEKLTPWANVFAQQQAAYILSELAPAAIIASSFGKQIDTSKIAQRYETEIRRFAQTGTKEPLTSLIEGVFYGS